MSWRGWGVDTGKENFEHRLHCGRGIIPKRRKREKQ
jgi:hypothetical protein